MLVRCMLRLCWPLVLEFGQGLCNVSGHGEVDVAFGVVPIQRYSAECFAFFVNCNVVPTSQGTEQMVNVVFSNILHPKVINNQGEGNWAPSMLQKTWCVFGGFITIFIEPGREQFVG